MEEPVGAGATLGVSTEALFTTPRTTAGLVEDPFDGRPARLHGPHSCPGSPDPAFIDHVSPEDLQACLAARSTHVFLLSTVGLLPRGEGESGLFG